MEHNRTERAQLQKQLEATKRKRAASTACAPTLLQLRSDRARAVGGRGSTGASAVARTRSVLCVTCAFSRPRNAYPVIDCMSEISTPAASLAIALASLLLLRSRVCLVRWWTKGEPPPPHVLRVLRRLWVVVSSARSAGWHSTRRTC